jgi:hypothetical protein
MNRATLRRILNYILRAAILGVVFSLGYGIGSWGMQIQYNTGWPNIPGCQLTTVARYPSEDGADLAIILKRDCDKEEHINYFLRLEINSRRPSSRGWWTVVELDNDQYPVGDPAVEWIRKNTVQVTVSTRTLSGTLVMNNGDDIAIIRVYQPREPGAFPNY